MESFIDTNNELIYDKYVSVHPEVHSDWTLEDAHNLEDFITKYISELIRRIDMFIRWIFSCTQNGRG